MDSASPAIETRPAYIGLGSNVGDRLGYLRQAVRRFDGHPSIKVIGLSAVYESPAHTLQPEEDAPAYLNAVILIQTSLAPEAILEECLVIERDAGRVRGREKRWQPRTLDCDLLVVEGTTRNNADLNLPHPRLHQRRFVLEPLADLAPNLYIPAPHNATVQELLARCADPNVPRRLSSSLLPSLMNDT